MKRSAIPACFGAQDKAPSTPAPLCSAWPSGLACLCFSGLTILLLQTYGHLHWKVIHHNYALLQDPIKGDLFRLLGYLEVYHLTGLLSLGFGVWTFRGSPRWMRWVCLPFGLLSLGLSLIVM